MPDFDKMTPNLRGAFSTAMESTTKARAQFLTPEDLLWAIGWQKPFLLVVEEGIELTHALNQHLQHHTEQVPDSIEYDGPIWSAYMDLAMLRANEYLVAAQAELLDVPHVLKAMLELPGDSPAKQALQKVAHGNEAEMISRLIDSYAQEEDYNYEDLLADLDFPYDDEDLEGNHDIFSPYSDEPKEKDWLKYATCLNDYVADANPLIGREAELERTMLVLCRKDKNNPLHVGEPGVGKTAIAYGLAALIEQGKVPQKLAGAKIYAVDMGAVIAGTQYRGEFEKRLKMVLKGAEKAGNAILNFDEIHNIVGAGRVEGSTLDASNLLKPYLERGNMRFMGATTYEEYKEVTRNKAFARRFEKIDIAEPSVEETKRILQGLKGRYEDFHHVAFAPEAIDFAADAAAKYINGRFLPDKAIDLIDEAGAWRQLHPGESQEPATVDKKLISEVLAKVCNVDMLAEDGTDTDRLMTLQSRLLAQIYGQDKAVREVAEAVELASAGLTDDNKPMASLLFVGPTGVGKTEVARVLAKELGLPLLRFDMSEYAEKHTVAKLIGAPAGYVGYDDGGLLTDAVRKQPHCVLLFDEIEKAHSDIYNIMLQLMDYAVLTDNKGQKADFRHVVLIMTTNAGAQYARQAGVGFTHSRQSGEAMLKSVKQTFKPEFLNRLTSITVFNDMDETMASRILDKKLAALQEKLTAKGVALDLAPEARAMLMSEGFSQEYGGREVERVINNRLKPLLMREILYGTLKRGGTAHVGVADGNLAIL